MATESIRAPVSNIICNSDDDDGVDVNDDNNDDVNTSEAVDIVDDCDQNYEGIDDLHSDYVENNNYNNSKCFCTNNDNNQSLLLLVIL